MKSLQKKLAEQKKQHQHLSTALEILYKEYGESLFEHTLKNEIPEDHPFFDASRSWKELKQERTRIAESVVTIKAALSRKKEVESFYQEADTMLKQQKKIHKQLGKQFAVLFFHAYRHNETVSCLETLKTKTIRLKESAEKFEEQQFALEEEQGSSSLVKKVLIKSKLTIVQQKLNHIKRTLDKQIAESYTSIMENSVIDELYAQNLFDAPLAEIYCKMKDAELKLHEIEKRQHRLTEEKEQLDGILHEYDEKKHPKKSIAECNERIKHIDCQMAKAETKHGTENADIFYTKTGVKKEGGLIENISDQLQVYVENIAEKRRKIAQIQINITYLENEIEIKQAELACTGLTKKIADHEKSIAQYKNMIVDAEETIAHKKEHISTLKEKNKILESDTSFPQEAKTG